MVYIIFSKKRHQYISGIFSSLVQAEEYVSRYDEASKESSNIITVELVYPFYLTEDEKGFRFHTADEAFELMKAYIFQMEAKDEDWCYTNLYLIKGDFQPEKPGHDYMGMLPHRHVENFTLNDMMRYGFENLF